MILLDATEVQIEFSDLACHVRHEPWSNGQRSRGIHVSDIIRYNWYGTSNSEDKVRQFAEDIGDPEIMPLCMALGLAWEMWAAGLYPEMQWQPGELVLDGVAGSPDGISIHENSELLIEEFKFTYKSFRNREILKETLWIWQIALYCFMAQTRFARLHVCWVNGDYRHDASWGPRYFRYLIEFKEHELKRLWRQLVIGTRDKVMEWRAHG